MEIVPSGDSLVVEARLAPSDVGQVEVGQPVVVEISTFDRHDPLLVDGAVLILGHERQRLHACSGPSGITMRPPRLSCWRSGAGTWSSASLITIASNGAFSGQP